MAQLDLVPELTADAAGGYPEPGTQSAPGRDEHWWREEMYQGHVIITDGMDYMRFWSQRRYRSLAEIRAAIDAAVKEASND